MSSSFPLSPSGLASVDSKWGGFRKGGSYLLVGHAHAGGPQHLMTTVRAAVETGEHCLLISGRSHTELAELAAQIGFDLPRASQSDQVRLLKSPPGKELAAFGDLGLARSFRDLIQLAETHGAGRVVMDDFSAFVQFRVFDAFAGVFRQLVRDAAAIDTTFVLGLGEPANNASKNLLRFIEGEVSGTVHTTTANDDVYEDTDKALYLPAKRSLEADLRAAREAADLTIEDIRQETRLATNILKRFETGRLIGDTSFNSVYLKAFLRLYANAVGLAPQKVEVALEAVWRGTYRGELHPSYAGSDGGMTVEEEPNSPTSDSGHVDADYVAPKEPVFPQVDPLPEAIPAASALPYSETKPTRRLQKKVRPSSGRSSDTAWGALLNVTVRRLLNRTEVDVHALTERREGGVPPSDVRSNSRLS